MKSFQFHPLEFFMNKSEFSTQRKKFAAKTIDELIESLSSDNLRTRFFAEMCLRDATNT